jgi:hypothetical protein
VIKTSRSEHNLGRVLPQSEALGSIPSTEGDVLLFPIQSSRKPSLVGPGAGDLGVTLLIRH